MQAVTGTLTATGNNYAYDMEFVVTQEMINNGAAKIAFDCHATMLSSVMIVKDRAYPAAYIPYGYLDDEGGVLTGKTAVFLGDSICAATTVEGAYYNYGWAGLIGEANGMTWKNYGKDGGTVTSLSAVQSNLWLTTQADLAITEHPAADYVIFEGGCNDADQMKDAGLGVISSNYSTFDTSTFSGAFEALVLKLVNAYPNAKIGYIIPQKMYTQNDHSAAGHVHRRFFDRAIEICQKWGIPVIDLWRASPLNPKLPNASRFYTDGQHLTLEGYQMITPQIEAWMCDLYAAGGAGTKGEKGDKGDKGDTGATGPKGDKGDPGTSATHNWNGTTLTITSASGTSSANLKGDKGDTGATGATGQRGFSTLRITTAPSGYTTATGGFTPTYRVALSTVLSQSKAAGVVVGDTVIYSYYTYPVGYVDSSYVYLGARVSIRGATGAAGAAGADGATPVRGTDYWTDVDKAAIVAEVIDSVKIEMPEAHVIYGDVDANNTITIYGELADGNYTLKYENSDGTVTEIGTIKVGGSAYTNLADPTSSDWATNKRLNSSAELADATGCHTTNFFPCVKGDVIRVKGMDIRYTNSEHTQNARAFFYKDRSASVVGTYPVSDPKVVFDGTDMFTITLDGLTNISGGSEEEVVMGRLSGMLFAGYTAEDVIITVNQEITG
jgi:lysophospholipase L1-like esterase